MIVDRRILLSCLGEQRQHLRLLVACVNNSRVTLLLQERHSCPDSSFFLYIHCTSTPSINLINLWILLIYFYNIFMNIVRISETVALALLHFIVASFNANR